MTHGPCRGRTGQSHTATPDLRLYDILSASDVTITCADGAAEVVLAKKPRVTKRPHPPFQEAWAG